MMTRALAREPCGQTGKPIVIDCIAISAGAAKENRPRRVRAGANNVPLGTSAHSEKL
jgi:hypothetical protein